MAINIFLRRGAGSLVQYYKYSGEAGMFKKIVFLVILNIFFAVPVFAQSYLWLERYDSAQCLRNRVSVPDEYERVRNSDSSFAYWLRRLPLKKGRPDVCLYNGEPKAFQNGHYAVLDIDIGEADLQQCADAVIRLRSEYMYSIGKSKEVHFNFTSGDTARFSKWIEGYRPKVDGNKVSWHLAAEPDSSYACFQKYLRIVYMYAGTYSLKKELKKVARIEDMRIGDVFIQGGFPGHAALVVDMAVDDSTGKKIFLLAQGYYPAQDFHILRNPNDSKLDPWYELDFGERLETPTWTFSKDDLMRF